MKRRMKIEIELEDNINYDELKEMLEKNNIHVVSGSGQLPPPSDGKKLAEILERIANEGGLESFPKDASEWQREQRIDRKLPFRD